MRIPHLLTLMIVGGYALTYLRSLDMQWFVMEIAWWDHRQMDSKQTVHQMPHKGHFLLLLKSQTNSFKFYDIICRSTLWGWSNLSTHRRSVFWNERRKIWCWVLSKWRFWLCLKWSPILPTCMRRLRSMQQIWKSLVITTSKNFKSSSDSWDNLAEGHHFSTISKPVHKLSTKCPIRGIFHAILIASNELKLWDIQSTAHPHLMRIPHLLTLTIVGVYALTYPKSMDMLRFVMVSVWWVHTPMDSKQTVH